MMFSIIIPTCNRNELLGKCLDKLFYSIQNFTKQDYEVIVTDDSKENIAKEFLLQKYSWVIWVEGPKLGPAANRNNGAKYAKGEWLLFTDDDCLPDENWLNSYKEAINNTGAIVYEGYTNADRSKQRFDEEAPINLSGGNLWSCNFAIKKFFFQELEGFDENFPFAAMEDIDLMFKIIKFEKIEFVPTAIIIHPWRRVKAFKGFYKHFLSHQYFRKKNVKNISNYRLSRLKIFIGGIYSLTIDLFKFHFKGVGVYLEKNILNFLLIFC